MKISFFLRSAKKNEAGEMSVQVQLSVNSERLQFSTGFRCLSSNWDTDAQRAKVRGKDVDVNLSKKINAEIDKLRMKFEQIELLYALQEKRLSVMRVKEMLLGNVVPNYGFLELMNRYISNVIENKLKTQEITQATMTSWEVNRKNLIRWLTSCNKSDLVVSEELLPEHFEVIKTYFIEKLEFSWNYTAKKMASLVSVLQYATDNRLIEYNPFAGLSMCKKDGEVDWLNLEELETLENHRFENYILKRVRDFFVFCCYTGLSYSDYDALDDSQHLQIDANGKYWIVKQRHKGANKNYGNFEIPMPTQAINIMQRYGSLKDLPKMENQTFNRLLKEVGGAIGDSLAGDRLHCHLARHTFIWWSLNIKKMSRESVSKMVGHADTKMLNKYAPITRDRIEGDLNEDW